MFLCYAGVELMLQSPGPTLTMQYVTVGIIENGRKPDFSRGKESHHTLLFDVLHVHDSVRLVIVTRGTRKLRT